MAGLELPSSLPPPRKPSPALSRPAATRATGLDLPGDLASPTVIAASGASAVRQRTSSPALDLPRDLPSSGGSGSADARVSQLEQELKKVKQEQDARVDIEVKAVQRFLQTQHQEAIAVVEARLTEATVALQAEQDRRQAAEQAKADYETEAKGIVNTWKTHYVALQGQLQEANEQLQQQGISQPNSPSSPAQAAELARLTQDNDALQQEVKRLQQEAAVKAEDTAAQQKLGEVQTQLEMVETVLKEAHAKLEEKDSQLTEAQGKADAAKTEFQRLYKQLQAEVEKYAREYSADIQDKDKEIKALKERGNNHRSGNRSKKSTHSQDDTQDKHRL